MLLKYRFDLTAATPAERTAIFDLFERYAETDFKPVTPTVFDVFFTPDIDVEAVIPLPEGCTVRRLA